MDKIQVDTVVIEQVRPQRMHAREEELIISHTNRLNRVSASIACVFLTKSRAILRHSHLRSRTNLRVPPG